MGSRSRALEWSYASTCSCVEHATYRPKSPRQKLVMLDSPGVNAIVGFHVLFIALGQEAAVLIQSKRQILLLIFQSKPITPSQQSRSSMRLRGTRIGTRLLACLFSSGCSSTGGSGFLLGHFVRPLAEVACTDSAEFTYLPNLKVLSVSGWNKTVLSK